MTKINISQFFWFEHKKLLKIESGFDMVKYDDYDFLNRNLNFGFSICNHSENIISTVILIMNF